MNERLIVIGITGIARSGKDTIAGILCQRFGFTRIALADGVRSAFRDLDGPTWELTKELEAAGKTSRWALQQLGTDARWKANYSTLWINLLAVKIAYLATIHPERRLRFVVPDVRFMQEANCLANAVGMFGRGDCDRRFRLWKVERPGAGLDGEAASHASEREIGQMVADRYVLNDGTKASLEAMVTCYAKQLLEAP